MEDHHDFGYGLRKEFWYKGIATEAGKALAGQVKKDGIPYITARTTSKIPEAAACCGKLV